MSDTPDNHDLLAAEYVLGLLTPEQRRAIEALAMQDPAMAASISAWQDRLAPLALAIRPELPPPMLWRRLALATGIDSVIASRAGPRRGRLWRSAGLWRATTVASLALAASLAILLARPEPTGRALLAALSPAGAPAASYIVRIDPDGRATLVAAATAERAGRQIAGILGAGAGRHRPGQPWRAAGQWPIPAGDGLQFGYAVAREPGARRRLARRGSRPARSSPPGPWWGPTSVGRRPAA